MSIYVEAEFEAYQILFKAGLLSSSNEPIDLHKCGDMIILLAEKIKAQRSTVPLEYDNRS